MRKLILMTVLLATSLNLFAQEIPKPEFPKIPYYLENGNLMSLHKEAPKQKGVYNTKYILKTENSDVMFDSRNEIEFIFEYSGDQDINTVFSIVIAEISKKGRKFNIGGFKAIGGKSKDNSENEIPFKIERIDDNIYKMKLASVESGQYAVVPQRDMNAIISNSKVFIYTFGVK